MKTAVSRLTMGAASVAVLVSGMGEAEAASVAADAAAAPVAGRLNLFEDVGAGGGRYINGADQTRDTNLHNDTFSNGHRVGDETSSVWNNTSRWAVLYEDDGYGGVRLCVAPRKHHADLSHFRWAHQQFGDKVSSYQLWAQLPTGIGCTWTVK